jgi:hypothetical protein
MVANAGLVAIMVAISVSGQRYRRAAVTRFLLLGANTLYDKRRDDMDGS